jgi:hypothetical protein
VGLAAALRRATLLLVADGLRRARLCRSGAGAGGAGRAFGPVPVTEFVLLFSEIISSAKTITVKSSKCLQGAKNTQKITKIPGKFLEKD